jgi:hypothetical protein
MSVPTGTTLPDVCSRETPTVPDSRMVRDTTSGLDCPGGHVHPQVPLLNQIMDLLRR